MYPRSLLLLLTINYCVANENRRSQNDSKIVGGFDADILQFPYQLFLSSTVGRCGASIISEVWALTAAHCLNGAKLSSVTFRSGSNNKLMNGTLHNATQVIVHPYYNSHTIDYDYALAQVTPPFTLGNPGVDSIKLASIEPSAGTIVTASGWGKMSATDATSPATLKAADLIIRTRFSCKLTNRGFTDRMICAKNTNRNICYGDSGGPLVDKVQNIQVGIMSTTFVGCPRGSPGFFSNVADQRQWISSVTGI